MSPRSVLAEVNPDLLRWARETAGMNLSDVPRSLRQVEEWERGEKRPTVRQLEALADAYKRPLAAFFLSSRPEEPPLPTDFRTLPKGVSPIPSKKVRLAMRTARRIQRLYADLLKSLGTPERPKLPRITVSGDPEEIGSQVRQWLGVSVNEQIEWRDVSHAFRGWREALESRGLLVLQLTMPVNESRGFSLSDGPIPTAVVSSSDAVAARIFTLFHELGHLMMNQGGICLPDPGRLQSDTIGETFCNRLSGAFLVPHSALRARVRPADLLGRPEEVIETLGRVGRLFKVSRYVVLFRLASDGVVKPSQLQRILARLQSIEVVTAKGGPVKPAAKTLAQLGPRFVSTVLAAHSTGAITYSDVSKYLSLNLKHLADLQRLMAIRG